MTNPALPHSNPVRTASYSDVGGLSLNFGGFLQPSSHREFFQTADKTPVCGLRLVGFKPKDLLNQTCCVASRGRLFSLSMARAKSESSVGRRTCHAFLVFIATPVDHTEQLPGYSPL